MIWYLLPIIALLGYRHYTAVQLQYFDVFEFQNQHFLLSTSLLKGLDRFRDMINREVIISPAEGAIFRFGTDPMESTDHLIGRGIDVMLPWGPDLETAYHAARSAGFNAVGVYPFWKPYPGLHLGIRGNQTDLFTWADIGTDGVHQYVELERGFLYG